MAADFARPIPNFNARIERLVAQHLGSDVARVMVGMRLYFTRHRNTAGVIEKIAAIGADGFSDDVLSHFPGGSSRHSQLPTPEIKALNQYLMQAGNN